MKKLMDLVARMSYILMRGTLEKEITGVTYDSRKVAPGCVFVCMVGAVTDGHQYLSQAIEQGAVAVVVERDVEVPAGVTVLKVQNSRLALAELAAAWFGHPADELTTIGITGTKGKTTSSYMIRSILEAAGHKTGLIGTIGAVVDGKLTPTSNTTPESWEVQRLFREMADAGCEYCVIEASSIGLKAHRVSGFTFEVGLFTNFSPDHIGGDEHADMEEYRHCKAMLFRQCRTGIINIDDPSWQGIIEGHTCDIKTYGFSKEAQLRAENEHLVSRPGYLGVHFDVKGEMDFPVDVDIPGKFNAYNALGAIAVCHHLGISQEAMQKGLDVVKVKGRVEPVKVPGNYTLLIDYAHNAVSMESILETLREYHPARLICLFGAGGNRPKIRRYEMGEVSGRMADLSVITADNSRYENVLDILNDIKTGLAKTDGKYIEIPDRREAIRWCLEHAQEGDIVVLAGKGHEDYQEIQGVKHPFDERVVIAELLKEMGKE